jgi:hypothetical protein
MNLQEQFSKAAAASTDLFLQLESIRRKLSSAQTPNERATLEAEAARLTEMVQKSKAEMKRLADQLVNPLEAKVPWWKRLAQSMFSKGKTVDVKSLRSPLLRELSASCDLFDAATERELAAVEAACGVALPQELRDILSESNGLLSGYGGTLLWSTDEIVRHNKEFRTDQSLRGKYQPFDKLFFIGDDASGDQFAYAVELDGKIRRSDIYRWDHETDARPRYAKDLEEFLRKALSEEG